MFRRGLRSVGDLRGSRPNVPASLADIYDRFYMLDHDGMSGHITSQSAVVELDEMGITRPAERLAVRQVWKLMESKQRDAWDKVKGKEKEKDGHSSP